MNESTNDTNLGLNTVNSNGSDRGEVVAPVSQEELPKKETNATDNNSDGLSTTSRKDEQDKKKDEEDKRKNQEKNAQNQQVVPIGNPLQDFIAGVIGILGAITIWSIEKLTGWALKSMEGEKNQKTAKETNDPLKEKELLLKTFDEVLKKNSTSLGGGSNVEVSNPTPVENVEETPTAEVSNSKPVLDTPSPQLAENLRGRPPVQTQTQAEVVGRPQKSLASGR